MSKRNDPRRPLVSTSPGLCLRVLCLPILYLGVCLTLGDASLGQEWAYPRLPPNKAGDDTISKHVPGSTKTFTQAQTENPFDPPDWYPDEHPPMPQIVAHGRAPTIQACARCHLANGNGHPESSSLAGVSVEYMLRQMNAFKVGDRRGVRADRMVPIAKTISNRDLMEALNYFSKLKPSPWTRVIETSTVPETFVGQGAMRFPKPGAKSEPLARRIIAIPEDPERAELRDPHAGFIEYVPIGSVGRGKRLVSTGGDGKTLACRACHGENLRGADDIPIIAGKSPIYIFRQLQDIKMGRRIGSRVELMQPVVRNLNEDDMIDIAAYLGSLKP